MCADRQAFGPLSPSQTARDRAHLPPLLMLEALCETQSRRDISPAFGKPLLLLGMCLIYECIDYTVASHST